ncbi:MFS transporter [Leucobacter sp. CSA2]|uniref:MFS transporter n=1 Tax=Leucobacter edaphi TaxID=2796472 RepID=A0A934UXT6_9MICO|nr:MFS transporter [Leucobacter edaphi]MBK0422420.1 MFS transporter [Leucobacter edaphi]
MSAAGSASAPTPQATGAPGTGGLTGDLPRRGGPLQRRTVWVLSIATVLGGLGVGASLSVGALLLAEVSGNDAISGLASSVFNAGAAIAGIPLARLAGRRGRRPALVIGSTVAMFGALIAIFSTVIGQWWLLAIGLGMLGVASAVQLLSRFTATDLAEPEKRARDLSLVVWAITVGAVVGPNLVGPGAVVGDALGIPKLAGVFVFAFAAQVLAAAVNLFGLRPDPLLTARKIAEAARSAVSGLESAGGSTPGAAGTAAPPTGDRRARILVIVVIAIAQAIMVGLMAMTPLHLMHHEGTPEIVGFTLSLHIAGMYALSPVFGTLASRYGRIPIVVLGLVVLLLSIVLAFIAGPSHLIVQVSLTLLGLGWSAVTVAGAALLTELTPEADRPRWQGRSDATMSAAGAIAGALSGVIFAIGDFSFLAATCAVLLALGAVASIQLGLRARRNARGREAAAAPREPAKVTGDR